MLQTPLEDMLGKDSLYMDITSTTVADFMEHDPECAACEWKSACCGGWKDRKDALLREIGVLG